MSPDKLTERDAVTGPLERKLHDQARVRRRPLREAASVLELAIAAPAGTGSAWCSRVRARALEVRAALEDHVGEVERPGGLADEITAQAPRLISLLSVLKAEHVELREALTEVIDMVDRIATAGDKDDVAAIRETALSLLGRIARHRQKGADLVYEAYGVDVGGE